MRQTKQQIMDGLTDVKSSKIVANNTVRYVDSKGEHVRLHNTTILSFINGKIILDSGGWQTVTTKERMSQFLPKYWYVQQEKSVWYLGYRKWRINPESGGYEHIKSNRWVFKDGITINKNGSVGNHGGKPEKLLKLNKQIGNYVKGYITALFEGKVPEPSSGDCWGCCMVDKKTGKTAMGTDHLISHIKEKYYVPSLLINAEKEFQVSPIVKGVVGEIWQGKLDQGCWADVAKRQLTSSLRRYMKRQLNLAA